ncbi:hypothetical protein HHI36_015004 [Cryptolaemus montrouzieri]|uniref:PHD-type domain-containing protein n=1 Tax=Cryptolaemus montrouzieri TaxID=559131 RepID=A0ABD2N4B8_9CUCU
MSKCENCKRRIGNTNYKMKCAEECNLWFHKKCADLTYDEFTKIKSDNTPCYCQDDDVNQEEDLDLSELEDEVLDEIPPMVTHTKNRKSLSSKKEFTPADVMGKLNKLVEQNDNMWKRINEQEKENKKIGLWKFSWKIVAHPNLLLSRKPYLIFS